MSDEQMQNLTRQMDRMQQTLENQQKMLQDSNDTAHDIYCALYKGKDGRGGLMSRVARLELAMYIIGSVSLILLGAVAKLFFGGL